MKKVIAYKAENHVLETDPVRASAWDIHHKSKQNSGAEISFSAALWLIENQNTITEILENLKKELDADVIQL